MASTYNTKPWQQKMASQIRDELMGRLDWLGVDWLNANASTDREVKVLDYACGTGMVSECLTPHATSFYGIDISPAMVEQYKKNMSRLVSPPKRAEAVVGNILGDPPTPDLTANSDYSDFDFATVGLGFHHFSDPYLAAKRLTERLKPAVGVLLIIDFLPHDHGARHGHGHKHDAVPGHDEEKQARDFRSMNSKAAHTINKEHMGFAEEGMRRMFEAAGLVDFGFSTMKERVTMEDESGNSFQMGVFFAKGRRPPHTLMGRVGEWITSIQDGAKGLSPNSSQGSMGWTGFGPQGRGKQ